MADFLESAIEIAHEAGSLLRYYFERIIPNKNQRFELKGDFDLVTEADRASEKLVVERLQARFPEHAIVAEEGSGHESNSEYRWYVDPLDGTTNFAHGYPIYNITLALEKAGELIAGVIFDPSRNELFTCEKGGGAFLNGGRIHVSQARKLDESLLSTGFPSRRRHQDVNIYFYHQLAMATHGVRRGGAAAIDLAYVACGRLDGFWEFSLSPWDMAAGKLLVAEAGGICTDMTGAVHHLKSPHILADNGLIHDQVVTLFSEIFRGEYRLPIPVIQSM
ncbi:MAG TPA: inositol monophosphatase family protein [Bryobacteraceae bacterium]|jgi:myo-inositol-1(or 4)-monophosphatase|nr:inositol monophosphatase family protein [Bryobacteraceae bacterium]